LVQKSCEWNVDGIDTWSQFHQHFISSFCSNIILPKNVKANTLLYKKVASKMLMKLTPGLRTESSGKSFWLIESGKAWVSRQNPPCIGYTQPPFPFSESSVGRKFPEKIVLVTVTFFVTVTLFLSPWHFFCHCDTFSVSLTLFHCDIFPQLWLLSCHCDVFPTTVTLFPSLWRF